MKKILSVLVLIALVWVSWLHQVIAWFVRTWTTWVADWSCGYWFWYDSASWYGYGTWPACASPYYIVWWGAYTPFASPNPTASNKQQIVSTYIDANNNPTRNIVINKAIDWVVLDWFLLNNKLVKPVYLSKNKCYGEIVWKFDIVWSQNSVTINLSQNWKTSYQFFPSIQKNGNYSFWLQQWKWTVKPGVYQMSWSTKTFLWSVETWAAKITVSNHCKKILKKKVLPMTWVAFIK